jgi:hypothetical protein
MNTFQEKLENILLLKRKITSVEKIDEFVKEEITQQKRDHLKESLKKSIRLVEENAKQTISISIHPKTELFVHSSYHAYIRSERNKEGYLSAPIFIPSYYRPREYYLEYLIFFDSQERRIIYFDEFNERCRILIEAVESGELDDLFGVPPFEILQQINGRYGELLTRLEINPWDSRIYREALNAGLAIPARKKSA